MDSRSTWEVPREGWAGFLTTVEALQRGKPVDLELIGPEVGDQPLAQPARLQAITATQAGAAGGTIEVDLGVDGGVDRRVLHPSHLYAIQAPSGQLECLDIEDESQTKTLIRFKQSHFLPSGAQGAPEPGRAAAFVREHMSSPARMIHTGTSIRQAYELMQRYGIRHLPVVDPQERLVGLLSDRELFLVKRERGIAPEDVTVEETMVRAPYAVSPETRLDEAAAVMAQRKYGCAVVVSEGRVAGVLTTTDALRALVRLQA